ncbi:MAG: carbohydrate-binding protein [Bacteroidales bacterium]|nr:carbohydrate-binding protein [Candidatus Scybalocola fimicaballi]
MKKLIYSILGSALTVSSAFADMQSVNVGGQNRQFYVHAPSGLTENRPLVISCHGMDQDIPYQRNQAKWEQIADTANFVVVYPGGGTGFSTWDISGDKDANFILAIIDEMNKKYAIDKSRVYMSGFSMGGMLTYHLMAKLPDKIAAFAPVSGHLMGGGSYSNVRPLPLIHVHGTSDSVVPYDGSTDYVNGWAKQNGCNPTPITTQYNNGYPNCTKEVWTGGKCETEVVRISFKGRDHEHNNSGALHTSQEIWNFVKNYSLECGKVGSSGINFSSPSASGKYSDGDILPISVKVGGKVEVKNVVVSVDGDVIATLTSEPWSVDWTATQGKHDVKAVATLSDGSEMEVGSKISVNAPQTPYKGVAVVLPEKVEAENYDEGGEGFAYSDTDDKNEGKEYRNDGVDIVDNQKGGYAIGYTKSGEWLEYTVEVLKDAEFGIVASASNGNGNFEFDVLSDGKKLATLSGSKTADWDTYTMIESKSKVSLTKGKHIIKVLFNTDYTNLDYLEFTGEKVDPTDVENLTFDAKSVEVYPNPARNEFMVTAPSAIRRVRVMTMSGVEVKESDNPTVDVSGLSAGNYLVEVTTDVAVVMKKVIVFR